MQIGEGKEGAKRGDPLYLDKRLWNKEMSLNDKELLS